ncbi:MAG: alkaline phosphatase family protein [Candidatus Aenigmarchaeota archaeon]|nr:alkaline phosphatase family protein [Candidatus Aenigmarchaeota archaeon]
MVAKTRRKPKISRKARAIAITKARTDSSLSASRSGKPRRKMVFLVIDGLADELKAGRKTPLQAAVKPNLDWMASNGASGELELMTEALWKGIDQKGVSQYANTELLGYSAERYPLGRGPLEALGAGLPYCNGHLAMRCNFASVSPDGRVVDRRAGRNIYGLNELARYVNEHVHIAAKHVFMRTYGHRAVLIIQEQLSDKLEGNDAAEGHAIVKVRPLAPEADRSAVLVQEFLDKARGVLEFHPKNSERIDRGLPPANYLLARQPGNRLPAFPRFAARWGLHNAVCIAENGVMKATCLLAGFSSINVPEFETNGEADQEKTLDFIFESIDSALTEYDFVYAHIKGADEAAHDKDPAAKRKIVEAIDKRLEGFRKFGGTLVVTCDHITSSVTGRHERGPVPVLVYGKRKDGVKKFDELSAKKGSLGRMSGHDLLKHIF